MELDRTKWKYVKVPYYDLLLGMHVVEECKVCPLCYAEAAPEDKRCLRCGFHEEKGAPDMSDFDNAPVELEEL